MRRDPPLDLGAEMLDQALDRPCRRITERADGMSLDLARHLLQRFDLVDFGVAADKALHHPPHPSGSLAARRALAAGFMLVEVGKPRDRLHDVGALVHHDYG